MVKKYNTAFVSFGGNIESPIGDPKETIMAALKMLAANSLDLLKRSNFYLTPAIPIGSGPIFINVVAKVQSDLNAHELLNEFHLIETVFNRQRSKRWGPRTLDIDLLVLEDQVYPSKAEFLKWSKLSKKDQIKYTPKNLILPHPRIQDRAFVLIPFKDLDENWVHPVFKKNINVMLSELDPNEYKDFKKL